MKLLIGRIVTTIAILTLAMLTSVLSDLDGRSDGDLMRSDDPAITTRLDTIVFAQDDNDNDDDNDDDDNDDDNDDDDNDDDNDDDDNDEDNDDIDNSEGSEAPGLSFDTSVTQASGITTGGDGSIGLPGDRIVILVFPWMPQGISLTLRIVDRTSVQAPTGALVFQVEATDAAGVVLSALPAEVNLSARYTNQEAAGLNKSQITLLWLDPAVNQWRPAPKIVTDPTFNYVAASTTGLGTYCVCVP
jgi:hypothetical protein